MLTGRLEQTVWHALCKESNGGMPNYPNRKRGRADFESAVNVVYMLRNRCSHQEHIVLDNINAENTQLNAYTDAIRWVAEKIDPQAAMWIEDNSRVAELRRDRPAMRP